MNRRWEVAKIGDICRTGAGGTPLKSEKQYYEGGTIPWLLSGEVCSASITAAKNSITELGLKESSAKIFPRNTVVVAMYGATAGQVGILRIEAATNQAVCGIYPNSKLIPEYLYYALLYKQADLVATASGNAQPNISQIKIKDTEVPFPSLVEQERIVAILDEAFAGIDTAIANTERNLANARELFDGTAEAIFLGDWNWERRTLLELLRLGWIVGHLDGNHGSEYPKKSEFVEEGVAYISANCLKQDVVNFANAKFLTKDRAARIKKGVAMSGDVIFAHNATVGPVALLETELDAVILSTSLTYYRCNTKHILPHYLVHYMSSPIFKRQYEAVMTQSTRNQVPITKQREFFHLIPSIEKQMEIVEILDSLRPETKRLESIYQQKITALAELKQSLLQKAFSGELTSKSVEDSTGAAA